MEQSDFNFATNETSINADAESAIALGYWYALVAMIGLPMDISIITSTFCIPITEFTPVNWLILALSITDCFILVDMAMILPYGITQDETI